MALVQCDDLGGFCGALDVRVHIIEVTEVKFFQLFADLLCLLSAHFDESVLVTVFIDVTLGVAENDSDLFVREGAAEHIVQGVEYVCFGAERLALFAQLFNARARRNRFAAGA